MPADPAFQAAPPRFGTAIRLLPGLTLTALVAWAGLWTSEWIGTELLGFESSPVSGIMMAIVIGLFIGSAIRLPAWMQPGIRFSLKQILRLGIVLLGIRLSLGDVLRLGALGIPLIILCISGALIVARWLSNRLNLSPRLSTLIGVGTSICGATAIVATGPAIDAREEEIAYAVANITVFGILAMLLYPLLGHAIFGDDMTGAGLFLGTAIHETAQVAGGGLIYADMFDADQALEAATVTKLVRNVFIAVVVPLMAYLYQQNGTDAARKFSLRKLFPVFIFGFILFAIFRTVGDATLDRGRPAYGLLNKAGWDALIDAIKLWAERALAMAMAGVGLGTSLTQLRGLGLKPFYAGFIVSLSVGAISLTGIAVLTALGLH